VLLPDMQRAMTLLIPQKELRFTPLLMSRGQFRLMPRIGKSHEPRNRLHFHRQ
jgi:hypothetical protein